MTFPVGSVRLMSMAVSTMGETELDTYFFRSGKFFLHEQYERRTARGRENALFLPFPRLVVQRDVRAERRFDHLVETEFADTRDDLLYFGVFELADDRGRDDRVHVVFSVVFGFFQNVDGLHDHGFIDDGAEGALIDARAAGNALVVVDARLFVFVHVDRLDLARSDARPLLRDDGAVRARLRAFPAFDALALVDDRLSVDDLNGVLRASLLTAVYDTAAAGRRDEHAPDGTFVAGDVDDFHHVGIVFIAAERQFDTFLHDGALLIDTTAHFRLGSRRDLFGDIYVDVIVTMFVFVFDERL